RRLVRLAEVAPARLAPLEGVEADELAQLQEVGHAARLLQGLVQLLVLARDLRLAPEPLPQRGDLLERGLQARFVARHAAVLPHDPAQLAMERVHAALAADAEEPAHALGHARL